MSTSIDRHRAAKRARHAEHAQAVLDDVTIYGAASDDAGKGFDTASLLLKAVGEPVSAALKAKEDKKAAEERAKHVGPAKDLRAAANAKANEAKYAQMEADSTEKEPYGPKHQKAQALFTEAADLDSKAREEETAAGMTPSTSLMMAPSGGSSKPFEFPGWVKYAAMGLGGVVVLGVGYKLLAGRSKR